MQTNLMQFVSFILLTVSALTAPLTAVNTLGAVGPLGTSTLYRTGLSTDPNMDVRKAVYGGPGNDYIDARTYQINLDNMRRRLVSGIGCNPFNICDNIGTNACLYGIDYFGRSPWGINSFGFDGYPYGLNSLVNPWDMNLVGSNDIAYGANLGLDVDVAPALL